MHEYIKLKSALKILDSVMSDEGIKHKGKAIRKRLKELPTADVVERRYCNQCRYHKKASYQYPCNSCRYCYEDKFVQRIDGKKEGTDNE